jgi:hypothetical protein
MAGETYVGAVDVLGANVDTEWTWVPWTPVVTAATTNPNIGAGPASGRYTRIGSLVVASFSIAWKNPGVSPGNGVYQISLPVAGQLNAAASGQCVGFGWLYDSSPVTLKTCIYRMTTTTTMYCYYEGTSNNVLSHGSPQSWADGDAMSGILWYEGT